MDFIEVTCTNKTLFCEDTCGLNTNVSQSNIVEHVKPDDTSSTPLPNSQRFQEASNSSINVSTCDDKTIHLLGDENASPTRSSTSSCPSSGEVSSPTPVGSSPLKLKGVHKLTWLGNRYGAKINIDGDRFELGNFASEKV